MSVPLSRRPAWLLRAVVLVLASGLLTVAPTGALPGQPGAKAAAAEVASTAATPAASSTHPFSAPIWSPLRSSAWVGCVKTNCTEDGGAYHGYWAIDFAGELGDPVHAAGAGIFHIGANAPSCSSSGQTDGVWVWVDHGGGLVTKYAHLDSITATEGQLVTPATMIGRMGHWGDTAPCLSNYLHFEVRTEGIKGPRIEPTSLRACTSSGVAVMPGIFNGATSFDAVDRREFATPSASSGCITDVWNKTPAQPTLTATRANRAAVVKWSTPPAGVYYVRIATRAWSSALGHWKDPIYSTVSASKGSATVTGLANGIAHQVQIAFPNSSGYSQWSSIATVTPATVPSAPPSPRYLTSPKNTYVHYGWYGAANNGAALTKYTTQVRCYRSGVWTAWKSATTGPTVLYYNHLGLTGYTSCQVRVNATNGMGTSAWSTVSSIRKSA
ncbi:Peptidase family M23 [Pedococcus dokdonensis]|uniref:Peptidase family M23 n=1 Tax=Pedococcus dokdonensis TaxID=443156 RepID=A0A1H0KY19_9MICO|nr:peptidoglycan DD-metalloendopeptidase family protein [Pedococcus dokdonensis]SDO60924.1 Peptidase family M23 [Pedococcus dokdonensis]